jgi:hypothetical protein
MTIYLKEFNDEGQYWNAPVFVVDQGKVVNGTFHLSALDMSALGSSDIPAPDGTGIQTIEFPQPGPYSIEVNVEAVAGSPIGMFVESATFGVVVE